MKKRGVYYNEIDKFCAQWLRNLIKAGHIAAGEVDERSITEVQAADLKGFTQCHFFAGIAGWSYALRLAGWADERECWTGSAPCQPWSVAGRQGGAQDERHLYPAWSGLIRACRPKVIFGEQVASADVLGGSGRNPKARAGGAWFDLVQSDLEDAQYTVGAVDVPAAGVGAPHIRQRLFFVAYTGRRRTQSRRLDMGATPGVAQGEAHQRQRVRSDVGDGGAVDGLADRSVGRRGEERTHGGGLLARSGKEGRSAGSEHGGMFGAPRGYFAATRGVAQGDASYKGLEGRNPLRKRADELAVGQASVVGGFWSGADWLACRDGKWRPVDAGTFPLAHGIPARVGKLRAGGNAIVPQIAAEFVKAYMECRP